MKYNGKRTCDQCPTQYEGTLPDGRAWYFRARRGVWDLRVAEEPMPRDGTYVAADRFDAIFGRVIAEGVDCTHGAMPATEVEPMIEFLLEAGCEIR